MTSHAPGHASSSHAPAGRARHAATIKDVARRAGVSVATVSRVLNASAPVREPTRNRILKAARDLHFTPNASARSLSTRRTTALGVVLPDLHGEFFSQLLRGIDRVAQQHGRHLLVSSSHHDAHGVEAALRAMHGRVDGLIVMAPDVPGAALSESLPPALPTVAVNCAAADGGEGIASDPEAPHRRVQMLAVDNFGGAVAMVRHLASLGHRRIAFVAGVADNADAQERWRGYRDAMTQLGLDAPAEWQPAGDFTEEGGWRAAQALLDLTPRPTAIFAANDMMAVGVLRALRERGVEVPAEMAVAGFDDIPTARHVTPPLTTVRVDVEALGARAATLLLALMATAEGEARASPRTRREVLPSTLITRDSCGPPAGSAVVSTPAASRGGSTTRSGSHATPVAYAPGLIQETVS